MGQQKGNPIPSYQNQAYETLRPNTGIRENRDGGTKPVMIDDNTTLTAVIDSTFATDSAVATLTSQLVAITSSAWTPVVSNKSGVFEADATINSAYYTKIGNIVQASFNISWTSAGGPSIPGAFNFTLPVLPNNNFSNTTSISGTGTWYNATYTGAARVGSGNGTKTATYSVSTLNANGSQTFVNVQYTIDN